MDKKELIEKYLIKEIDVSSPDYMANLGGGYHGGYSFAGSFSTSKVKQLDIEKLCALLSKLVKVEDIVEKD